MRFWSQILAFYFLQFINVWISVIMVLFHNTEGGNKGNKLKNWLLLLLLLSLVSSDCVGLAYGAVTWWTNNSNPKTRNRWTYSSTEPFHGFQRRHFCYARRHICVRCDNEHSSSLRAQQVGGSRYANVSH